MKRIIKTGDEQDAYTSFRKYVRWRPGVIKKIKQSTHKRERREAKHWIDEQKGD